MMKMKKLFVLFGFVLAVILMTLVSDGDQLLYGNNEELIVEVINSIDSYSSKTNRILGIYDFDDDRVVAFLNGDTPAMIRFKGDDSGNYNLISSWMESYVDINNFLLDVGENDDKYLMLTVKNGDSDINGFSFTSNGIEYSVIFESESPYVQLTELENNADNSFRFAWPDLN